MGKIYGVNATNAKLLQVVQSVAISLANIALSIPPLLMRDWQAI